MPSQQDLMQYLLPWLQGATTTQQKGALDIQAKGTNNAQDLIQLLFDPKFAALTGTSDPLQQVPQTYEPRPYQDDLPLTMMYMNSGDPVIAEVASGLVNGTYDPLSARTVLTQSANASGLDPLAVGGIVDSIAKEIADNASAKTKWDRDEQTKVQSLATAPKDDVYTNAGLPSPLEQYNEGNIPLPQDQYARQAKLQQASTSAQSALQKYLDSTQIVGGKPTPALRSAGTSHAADTADVPTREAVGGGQVPLGPLDDPSMGSWGGVDAKLDPNGRRSAPSHVDPQAKSDGDGTYLGAGPTQGRKGRGSAGTGVRGAAPSRVIDQKRQALINAAMASNAAVRDSQGFARGYASVMAGAGRTPLGDKINDRMAQLQMLGLV